MATEKLIIEVSETGARIVKRDLEDIGRSATKAQTPVDQLRSALVALGGIAALKQVLGTISKFDEELARLRISSGASAAQLNELADAARRFGVESGLGATESAKALDELTRAGIGAQEAMAGLTATNDLAQGTFARTEEAARGLGLTMRGFGVDATRAADILAEAARRNKLSIDDLGQSFRRVGPVATSLGISLEVVASASELLADSGIRGAASGVALADAFRQLESPSEATRRALAEIGVNAAELRPSAVGLAGALQQLAAAGIDAESATRIFGGTAGLVLGILAQQADQLGDLEAKYKGATGSARAFSQVVEATIPEAIRQVRAALEELALKADIVGPIRASLKIVEGLINETSNSIRGGNLGLGDAAVNAAISLDALRAVIAGAAASAVLLWDNAGIAIKNLFTSIANFAIRVTNEALLLIQRAINATIESINSFSASLSFGKLATDLRSIALPQIPELRAAGTAAGQALGDAMGTAFEEEFKKHTFRNIAEQALAPLPQGQLSRGSSFEDQKPPTEKLKEDAAKLDTIGRGLKDAFLAADQSVRQLGKSIGDDLVGAIDSASQALAKFALSGFRNIEDLRAAVSSILNDLATQILATVIKALLLKAITETIGSGTGGISGLLTTAITGAAAGRAEGGPVEAGRPYIVGDGPGNSKPELFVPDRNGRIVPNSELGSLGQQAQPNITVAAPQVVIVKDEKEVFNAMESSQGEATFIKLAQRNRETLKGILA